MNHIDVTVTPLQYVDGVGGWNPWGELRRREHIQLGFARLPDACGGAFYARWAAGDAVIAMDRRLTRCERRAALAHELIHDERSGDGDWSDAPTSWRPRMTIDEHQVDDEVARRLVPPGDLLRFVEATVELGTTVGAFEVAEEFDVPEPVAERALVRLGKQSRERRKP